MTSTAARCLFPCSQSHQPAAPRFRCAANGTETVMIHVSEGRRVARFCGLFQAHSAQSTKDLKLLTVIVSAASAMGRSFVGLILSTVAGLGQVLLRDINADLPT